MIQGHYGNLSCIAQFFCYSLVVCRQASYISSFPYNFERKFFGLRTIRQASQARQRLGKIVSSTLLLWWIWPDTFRSRAFFFGAPSLGARLEVMVHQSVDHSERSEAQLHEGDRLWGERSEGPSVERRCEPMNRDRI